MERTTSIREAFDDFLDGKEYQGVIRRRLLGHRQVSGATLATDDRSLRVTFNGFEKRGYSAASPMANLPKRKLPRTVADTFDRAELQAMERIALASRSGLGSSTRVASGASRCAGGAGDRTRPHADGGRQSAGSSVSPAKRGRGWALG